MRSDRLGSLAALTIISTFVAQTRHLHHLMLLIRESRRRTFNLMLLCVTRQPAEADSFANVVCLYEMLPGRAALHELSKGPEEEWRCGQCSSCVGPEAFDYSICNYSYDGVVNLSD